jgi:hypothetical protein
MPVALVAKRSGLRAFLVIEQLTPVFEIDGCIEVDPVHIDQRHG